MSLLVFSHNQKNEDKFRKENEAASHWPITQNIA